MVSYDTLRTEACWRAQFTPPALNWLAVALRERYNQDANSIGSPGDNFHLRGAHRSRRWILESQFCTDDEYTVSLPADKLGDSNWYAGIDINPGSQIELYAMCRRLDEAVRAGKFESISEWYGNFGDDGRVDGWDNIYNHVATSDNSHLTHLHITFLRRDANDLALMRRVFATLTGDTMEPLNTDPDFRALIWRVLGIMSLTDSVDNHVAKAPELNSLSVAVKRIDSHTKDLAAFASRLERIELLLLEIRAGLPT